MHVLTTDDTDYTDGFCSVLSPQTSHLETAQRRVLPGQVTGHQEQKEQGGGDEDEAGGGGLGNANEPGSFEFEFGRHFLQEFLVRSAVKIRQSLFVLEHAGPGIAHHVRLTL